MVISSHRRENMFVDFVLRDNSERKGGGDLVQVQMYAKLLKRMGWDVRLLPYSPNLDLRAGAIVHVVNVDRPFDALSAMRQAGSRPVFVSSIHHSLPAVRRMRRTEAGLGLRSFLGRILPENVREFLSFTVRCLLNADGLVERFRASGESARLILAVPRVWRSLGRSLDRVDGVFLLAEGEGLNLRTDTSWKASNSLLAPNGVPETISDGLPWRRRSDAILVVGRIEPRKRQLELVRSARRRQLRIVLVGELQQPDSPFGLAFRAALTAAPNVEWRGVMSHDETVALMGVSKIVVNPSWVEVQSLVELEAALAGAWVIGSAEAGNSAEWLGDAYRGVADDDIDAMLGDAEAILRADEPPKRVNYDWSWQKTVSILDRAYRHALR